jgi:hypothetical protein
VWFDEERLPPGCRFEDEIRRGVDASDGAVFLISREWLGRDHTKWELTQFGRRTPPCQRLIPVVRGPRHLFERDIPAHLAQQSNLEWPPDATDAPRRFWQLLAGLTGQPPGPSATWTAQGEAALSGVAPPPPVASPRPHDPRARRVKPGQGRPSLTCDRSAHWGMVDTHAQEPVHEVLVVPGARGMGHEHFLVRVEQELRRDPRRWVATVSWGLTRPATQDALLEKLADSLEVDTGARVDTRARLASAIEARLAHENLVLIHPCIRDHFDDEEIVRYYGETLPSLIADSGQPGCLKCLQPIEWRMAPALKRLGARVAAALWPGLTSASWVDEGCDEHEAAHLIQALCDGASRAPRDGASGALRVCSLPPLGDIPEAEVEEFCQRLGLTEPQRRRLLALARSVSRTPEDFLEALDQYYPSVCGTNS